MGSPVLPFSSTLSFVFRTSGGKATAIEAARLVPPSSLLFPKFERFLYAWDQASPSDQERLNLEDLCSASDIPPDAFLSEVVPVLWRRNQDIGKIVAAVSHPAVIQATVDNAVNGGTFGSRDREMLHQNSGFLPTKGGFSVNIDNSQKTLVAGQASVSDVGGLGLPAFEDDVQQFNTALRDGADTRLLPPPSDSQEIVVPYEDIE